MCIRLSIVEHMSDSVKNYFIRNVLSKDPNVELDNELPNKYCKFLIKYYPTNVFDFVLQCKDINELSKMCQDHEIFDACAVIAATLEVLRSKVFAKNSNLKCSMSYKYKQADARKEKETRFLHEAICEIIENYAIPIYVVIEQAIELKPVQQGLHNVCIIGYSLVKFEKLLKIIGEYGELTSYE